MVEDGYTASELGTDKRRDHGVIPHLSRVTEWECADEDLENIYSQRPGICLRVN